MRQWHMKSFLVDDGNCSPQQQSTVRASLQLTLGRNEYILDCYYLHLWCSDTRTYTNQHTTTVVVTDIFGLTAAREQVTVSCAKPLT